MKLSNRNSMKIKELGNEWNITFDRWYSNEIMVGYILIEIHFFFQNKRFLFFYYL